MFPQKSDSDLDDAINTYGFEDAVEFLLLFSKEVKESCSQKLKNSSTEVSSDMKVQFYCNILLAVCFVNVLSGKLCLHIEVSTAEAGCRTTNLILLDEPTSGKDVLVAHSKSVLSSSGEYVLIIDRTSKDKLWLAVVSFYKGAIKDERKLRRELVIEFDGEAGADFGALRQEFFEDALKEAYTRLLAGDSERRIPKKDWSFELLFEILGMLIAHSIGARWS